METIAQEILLDFKANSQLIHRFVDGVTDQEAVRQLPFEANCMNWLLGHMVSRRHSSLLCLGQSPLWPEELLAKYRNGSQPIKSVEQGRPFGQLVADLDTSQQGLEAALENATRLDLEAEFENDRGKRRVVDHLRAFHWHETFHLGQIDILRSYIESNR